MAIDQQVGTTNIRTNAYDLTVKGFAEAMYKFKQALTISPTSAWRNFFYRENSSALTAQTGNAIQGIPRGGNFPQAVVEWERVQANILKFGLEDNIHWEDILSNDIDVRNRTLFRIAEGVTKAVDDYIVGINGFGVAVLGTASFNSPASSFSVVGKAWNATSAAIVDDLMRAKQLIAEQNYDTTNLMLFVNPRDHRSIVKWLSDKGAQFPSISEEVVNNGRAGRLAGIQLVVSNSMPTSCALCVVPKVCATLRELVPLQTTTTEDPYKSVRVRSVEECVFQFTDPKAAVIIHSTLDQNN